MHRCTMFATPFKILYVCMYDEKRNISNRDLFVEESMPKSEGLLHALFVVGKVNTCVYVHMYMYI